MAVVDHKIVLVVDHSELSRQATPFEAKKLILGDYFA